LGERDAFGSFTKKEKYKGTRQQREKGGGGGGHIFLCAATDFKSGDSIRERWLMEEGLFEPAALRKEEKERGNHALKSRRVLRGPGKGNVISLVFLLALHGRLSR